VASTRKAPAPPVPDLGCREATVVLARADSQCYRESAANSEPGCQADNSVRIRTGASTGQSSCLTSGSDTISRAFDSRAELLQAGAVPQLVSTPANARSLRGTGRRDVTFLQGCPRKGPVRAKLV